MNTKTVTCIDVVEFCNIFFNHNTHKKKKKRRLESSFELQEGEVCPNEEARQHATFFIQQQSKRNQQDEQKPILR